MSRAWPVCLGVALVGGSVPSCAVVIGVDGDYREVEPADAAGGSGGSAGGAGGSSGSGGSSASGATGGAAGSGGAAGGAACGELGRQCQPAPPLGWTGPIALSQAASAPPACSGDFPTNAIAPLLNGGLEPGSASCTCACAPDPASCAPASLKQHGATTSCPVGGTITSLAHNSCESFGLLSDYKFNAEPAPLAAGPCTSSAVPSIPTPTWSVSARACLPANTDGACAAGQVCMPTPASGAELCIYQSGDQGCPAEYPQKHLLYDGYDDGRQCGPCTCGAPSGSCGGTLSLYSDINCATSVGSGALGACLGPFAAVRSARLVMSTAGVSCVPSQGSVTGTVQPQNAVTFCCMP